MLTVYRYNSIEIGSIVVNSSHLLATAFGRVVIIIGFREFLENVIERVWVLITNSLGLDWLAMDWLAANWHSVDWCAFDWR